MVSQFDRNKSGRVALASCQSLSGVWMVFVETFVKPIGNFSLANKTLSTGKMSVAPFARRKFNRNTP
jgi:hypothetical protein